MHIPLLDREACGVARERQKGKHNKFSYLAALTQNKFIRYKQV